MSEETFEFVYGNNFAALMGKHTRDAFLRICHGDEEAADIAMLAFSRLFLVEGEEDNLQNLINNERETFYQMVAKQALTSPEALEAFTEDLKSIVEHILSGEDPRKN